MNADAARKMAEATLTGDMRFPEIVGNLLREGVKYYHVDFVSRSFTSYSAGGGLVVAPLAYEGLPGIATRQVLRVT